MLTLKDGRTELWQWDTGRELKVEGECSQVHFSNKIQGRSIDVDVVDGVAKIPDVLLQTDGTLNAWAFVGTAENGYTKVSKSFVVNKRNRPADYVFTPTDQTSIKELNDRLEKLEANQDPEAVGNAVKEYLENNPIKEVDPTVPQWAKEKEKPTYTADEVGALPKTTKIPSKTSELTNDSGYLTSVPSEYVTETELTAKGYAKQTDVDNLSKEIDDLKENGGSGSVKKDTFEAYDKFYESIANMRVNPNTPLNIITYDGSNKPTHPSVLYCEDGFANHKYWMAYSPFPNNNNTYENPCIAYSEDGVNFISDGITNPIEDTPMEDSVKVGYNSDPHLVIVNGVMECWWRTHYQSGTNANHEVIYRKTSNDGITWSAKEELFRVEDASAGSCLSPTVIYEDDIYKIWCVYKQQVLKYYESADGLNWEYVRDINVDNSDYPTYKIWHFDIKHTVKGYEFVGCYHPTGDYNDNKYIFYAVSSDNVTYSPRTLVLTNGLTGNFDATELYRPSIIREEYGVKIYYGCRNGAGNWKIGMIEAPNPYLFNAVLKNQDRFNSILTRLTNLENGSGGSGGADTTIACTSVSLDKTTLTFDSNATQTLVATVEPTNTTETLSWVSNNTSIATVANGVVTPIANGSCVITANCGSCSASCQVTVNIETENEEPTVDGVANSFADSTWTAGYYNDIGEIATFDRMHHSQLMPVGEYTVSVPVVGSLRVSYFDADKNYLNYDFGNGIGKPMGEDTNTSIDVDPEAGVYFAVSYNSADKSKVTVSVIEHQFTTTAEPIACYLGNNHGSVDGEWTEVGGGTSITLNGGTWDNGILLTDGVDDNLVLPLVNAKSVVIKAKLLTEHVLNNTKTIGYVFDTRTDGTAYLLNYTNSNYIGTGASVYAGTRQFGSAGFAKIVKVGEWYYFTIVFNSNFTGNMRICSHNSGNSDFMQAEIEEIKVYDVDITV